jgi:hypothetical protein
MNFALQTTESVNERVFVWRHAGDAGTKVDRNQTE